MSQPKAYSRTDVVNAIKAGIADIEAKLKYAKSSSTKAMLNIDLEEKRVELQEVQG